MKIIKTLIIITITINYTNTKQLEFPKINILKQIPNNHNHRPSSSPYLSGDTFRSFCNFIIDKTNKFIDPEKIKNGDIIFVANHAEFLDFFFQKVHPKIKSKYILVTHNSDKSEFSSYLKYLDDKNIVAWFGENLILKHKKAFPIPIGLANRYWKHGNIDIIDPVVKNLPEKNILLYMNLATHTNKEKRLPVYNLFSKKTFCYNAKRKPFKNFIYEMAKAKFVLSPEGNGIDCHRTWEALYLGAIPVVTHSKLDKLFKDLPVIMVDDWNVVSKDFLEKKYEEMRNKTYKLEKLFADYWIAKIQETSNKLASK